MSAFTSSRPEPVKQPVSKLPITTTTTTVSTTSPTVIPPKSFKYYFSYYLQEVLEVLIFYVLYALLTNSTVFDAVKALKISCVVGIVSLLLEEYNPVGKSSLKAGLFTSIGAGAMKTHA